MRMTLIWFLALSLATILATNCATAKEESGRKGETGNVSEGYTIHKTRKIPSNLLPTLGVAVDSCYVFLRPDKRSPYFGPLRKGEKIKRLDGFRSWIFVWIPRLLISGWVLGEKVYAKGKIDSSEGGIPVNLMTILIVLRKEVNIRKAPTTRSRIIFKAKKGQELRLLNEKKGWYQLWIPHLKMKGWVYGKLVGRKRKN